MVKGIRDVELALGDGIKGPRPSEIKNKEIARKSLVAACDIEEGAILCADNLAIKRPGDGMSPYAYWQLLGQPAKHSYLEGEPIYE